MFPSFMAPVPRDWRLDINPDLPFGKKNKKIYMGMILW